MIKKFSKIKDFLYKNKLSIITFIIGFLISPLFVNTSGYFIEKKLNENIIYAKNIKINNYKIDELNDLYDKLNLKKLEIFLDDKILNDYYLISIQIINSNNEVNIPLLFRFFTGSKLTRIIDVQKNVYNPANKVIVMEDSLPELQWDWPQSFISFNLKWDSPQVNFDSSVEYNIYGSMFRDRGYGRINATLVNSTQFEVKLKPQRSLEPTFWKVAGVNVWGGEGELSETYENQNPIPLYSYVEKDNGGDNINVRSENLANEQKGQPIKSFTEGAVDLSFPDGFDPATSLELFILCKALPGVELAPQLSLIGAPSVRFSIEGVKNYQVANMAPLEKINERRMFLTPEKINTYALNGSIYFSWEKPEPKDYVGVRVFRSSERLFGDFGDLGLEISNGENNSDKVILNLPMRDRKQLNTLTPPKNQQRRSLDPPPKTITKDTLDGRPAPPKISSFRIINTVELDRNYFVDAPPNPHDIYTYTFFTVDNEGNYGYPVIVNASLLDTLKD